MPDFLLELLSEEIPARMQARAREDLARLFEGEIAAAGLIADAIETHATPRRLALIARGLPAETAAVREELKGPRAGAPEQAVDGFLRKTGLARDALVERDGLLFALVERPGRQTAAVLAEAVPAVIRAFPWPKSMRWGAASASTASLRWVRPLQGVVALFGEDIVDIEIDGLRAGASTVGHRFHHAGIITIGSAGDYAEKLRACHVVIDPAEREALIRKGAAEAAAAAGLALVEDDGLVAENAGLTEWPVPLLGSFDRAFLDVPREVIQLTMRTNQKYFACTDAAGDLAPNFICTANIEASDGGAAIAAGNARVLAARLSDARFFWEQDLKVPLEDQARKLDQIVFHEKLGTVAGKVDRVATLARWLVEQGIVNAHPTNERHPRAGGGPALASSNGKLDSRVRGNDVQEESEIGLADQAERAGRLAKADLVSGMVGEFPELQGIMGRYYALRQGEPAAVADAIEAHYRPLGPGDACPGDPVSVAVALAEKIDTLAGFFGIDERPTGSKDPFALRRAALSVIRLVLENRLRAGLTPLFTAAAALYRGQGISLEDRQQALIDFFADRLKVQQREAGVRHDLIDAVFSLGGEDDLVRLLARVKALQSFVETGEGADLLAGYKRAANILRKEGWTGAKGTGIADEPTGEEDPFALADDPAVADALVEYAHHRDADAPADVPLPQEAALIAALDAAEPKARAAVKAEDFEAAMAALATLRGPVDAFFDKVTVNDPDPARREARLALLGRMRDAVHQVADFSKIEG